MSSKFFTWTKGDRSRNSSESLYSGAVVPIPVECIHIKGFDYSRTQKKIHRRPVPLRLEPSPEVVSAYDHTEDDSTALQDAAVRSATSLIAVVNDMLRSPLASARLPPPTSTLAPTHGRPRSRTAPSTPLVELPVAPLVELPGSIPARPCTSQHRSYDGKRQSSALPNSNAKRSSHPWLHRPFERKDDEQTASNPCHTLPEYAQHAQPVTPQQHPNKSSTAGEPSRPDITPRRIWSEAIQSHGTLRPVPSTISYNTMHKNNAPKAARNQVSTDNDSRISYETSSQMGDTSQVSHASSLQASHEAHLAALMEAHQREIASLNVYIAQLEHDRGLIRNNNVHAHPMMRQHAHIHNAQFHNIASSWRSTHQGYHGSTRPDDPLSQGRPASEQHCTSSAGCGELWLECNNLRNTLEAANTKLSHTEYTVQRLQSHNKSQSTTIEDLQRRLLAANNERLDVREGLHDACCRVRNLVEREAGLVGELEKLRRCSSSATTLAASQQEQDAELDALKAEEYITSSKTDLPWNSSISQGVSPSISPSQTPSPNALGISTPSTPCTSISTNPGELPANAKSPEAFVRARTPLTGAYKDLPQLPSEYSPTPVLLRRGNTVKSVGESIIELYEKRDGDGWESGWETNEHDDMGRTSWGVWV